MSEQPDNERGTMTLGARLRLEASALALAPILLTVAALVALAAIWGILHLSYSALLSSKDTRIAVLERRLSEYRAAVAGAPPEDARRRIESLESEVKSLRVRLEPRRLTDAQRVVIADASRLPAGAKPTPVTVVIEDACSDCMQFGKEMIAALDAPGTWIISTVVVDRVVARPRTGLAVRIAEPTRPPAEAVILQRVLRAAKMSFLTVGGGTGAGAELVISERLP